MRFPPAATPVAARFRWSPVGSVTAPRPSASTRRSARSVGSWLGWIAVALLLGGYAVPVAVSGQPPGVQAQSLDTREESRRLREASALEWRGRIEEAQEVLAKLLDAQPTSSGGLFGLERILRNLGRLEDVLPYADRYLEVDPAASGVRYMKLRVLVELDSLDALRPEARAWFANEPGSEDPYREVSRLYQRALGDGAALELLQEARETLADPTALALEMGDLYSRTGEGERAVAEWSTALRGEEADLQAVLRRLGGLEGDPAVLAEPLLGALTEEPTTLDRRLAAVRVALELGLESRAGELAEEGSSASGARVRRRFLAEVTRSAEEAGRPGLAVWALNEERELAPERERTTLDLRLAAAALQAGDTAQAVAAQTRLSSSLPPGSVERRRVMAELIRVGTASASPELLVDRLGDFRREYPQGPEVDELTARVAGALAVRGDSEAARLLIAEAPGPLSALEGGFLHFLEGEVDTGQGALQEAVGGLAPSQATGVLRLLSFLTRLRADGAETLAEAAAHGHHGRWEEGVQLIQTRLPELEDEDRPTLLAWAGEMAVTGEAPDRAESLLEALVEGYPESREYPDGALALARLRLEGGDAAGARTVLEALILTRPENPVVPAARRELQRIRNQGGRP